VRLARRATHQSGSALLVPAATWGYVRRYAPAKGRREVVQPDGTRPRNAIGWRSRIEYRPGDFCPQFLPRCISGRDSRRSPNPRVALMHTGQQQTCRSLSRHGNVRKPTNSKRRRPDLSRSNESAAIGVVSLAYRSLGRRSRLSKGACKDRNARHDDLRFLVPNGRIPAGGHTRHSRLCRAERSRRSFPPVTAQV
jgi:hypothetical protein